MGVRPSRAVFGFCVALALASCSRRVPDRPLHRPLPETPAADPAEERTHRAHRVPADPIEPLPDHVDVVPARAALGARLFADPQMSGDGSVACATCHRFDRYGADGRARSIGAGGSVTSVNTPSIFNVAFNARLNWTGRFTDLESHHDALIQNPSAMGSSWVIAVARVRASATYVAAFAAAYPGAELSEELVRDAIVSFERSLVTPNAPFDRFLRGDAGALSNDARDGWRRFEEYGCVSCHQGVNVGGNLLQRFGVMKDHFDPTRASLADLGRYAVTHDDADRFVFRVPSLRNVARTAPYFHDGSAATLEDAITVMADVQLGRALDAEDTRKIVSFLDALTGEAPARP